MDKQELWAWNEELKTENARLKNDLTAAVDKRLTECRRQLAACFKLLTSDDQLASWSALLVMVEIAVKAKEKADPTDYEVLSNAERLGLGGLAQRLADLESEFVTAGEYAAALENRIAALESWRGQVLQRLLGRKP
jgi:hypothetical protein